MKTHIPTPTLAALSAALVLSTGTSLRAQQDDARDHEEHADHDHSNHEGDEHGEHARQAGPNGGRLLTATEPHAELLVLPDRKLQITFVNHDGEVVEPTGRSASAIGGDRSDPTRFAFEKRDGALVSDNALPEGDRIPLILRLTPKPDAETTTERFVVNLTDCPTCDYREYACICDHAHDH